MRYTWRDLPALLRTPIGQSQLLAGVGYRAWPLLSRVARLNRATLARNTRVVAVVGSYGKTTTARAVTAALGRPLRPDIELNEWSYVARAVLRIRPWDHHAVIEVGIGGPGQMAAFARMLRPDIVVATSIGSEHHRSLGTLEATRAEKAEMVRALPRAGLAFLNGDDPNVCWMRDQTRATVRTFGLTDDCDIRATNILLDWPHGSRLTVHAGGTARELRVQLIGRHLIYPVLAAVGVALAEGRPLNEVVAALEALAPTPGRLEPIPLPSGAWLLRDDFKSGLETIEAALDVLEQVPARRRIVVLGDVSEPPGSQGPIYRRLGERIAHVAARLVIVGANYQRYAAGATAAGLPRTAIIDAHRSVLQAAAAVGEDLGAGDVVLIKGRDTQRLDRVALALMGRAVRCDIAFCNAMPMRCARCPMLERGWDGLRVVI